MSKEVLSSSQVDDMAFGYAPSGKIGELRELIRAVESVVLECVSPPAANKAAEEGELPVAPWTERHSAFETPDFSKMARMEAEIEDWREYFRASRQVANKTEVEPVAWRYRLKATEELPTADKWSVTTDPTYVKRMGWAWEIEPLYATHPATAGEANASPTGASTARSIDTLDFHNLLRMCMKHSDDYPTHSARLIDYINSHFASAVDASTVLTGKQTDLAKRLLKKAEKCSDQFNAITITKADLIAICCEANRYYSGMVAWKKSAEAKDQHFASEVAAQAGQVAVPEGFALMPRRLTAENGAKSLLIGEFNESTRVTCHECDGSGEDSEYDAACVECGGEGTIEQKVAVEWDTIKRIYDMAVEHLAAPSPAKESK